MVQTQSRRAVAAILLLAAAQGEVLSGDEMLWVSGVSPGFSGNAANTYMCAATLIDADWAVLPAHCEVGVGDAVHVGRYDLYSQTQSTSEPWAEIHSVARVWRHRGFATSTFEHDIALVKLCSPSAIQPAKLAAPLDQEAFDDLTAVGWGDVSALGSTLTKRKGSVVRKMEPTSSCYDDRAPASAVQVQSTLCSLSTAQGETTSCEDEVGGHLFLGNQLVGLPNWKETCDKRVFTKVSYYQTWLTDIMDRERGRETCGQGRPALACAMSTTCGDCTNNAFVGSDGQTQQCYWCDGQDTCMSADVWEGNPLCIDGPQDCTVASVRSLSLRRAARPIPTSLPPVSPTQLPPVLEDEAPTRPQSAAPTATPTPQAVVPTSASPPPTAPPSLSPTPAKFMRVKFKLNKDIDTIPEGSDERKDFEQSVLKSLALVLAIDESRLALESLEAGSVLVTAHILPSPDVNDRLTVEVLSKRLGAMVQDQRSSLHELMPDLDRKYFKSSEEGATWAPTAAPIVPTPRNQTTVVRSIVLSRAAPPQTGMDPGHIAAIVLSILAVAIAAGVATYCFCCKPKDKDADNEAPLVQGEDKAGGEPRDPAPAAVQANDKPVNPPPTSLPEAQPQVGTIYKAPASAPGTEPDDTVRMYIASPEDTVDDPKEASAEEQTEEGARYMYTQPPANDGEYLSHTSYPTMPAAPQYSAPKNYNTYGPRDEAHGKAGVSVQADPPLPQVPAPGFVGKFSGGDQDPTFGTYSANVEVLPAVPPSAEVAPLPTAESPPRRKPPPRPHAVSPVPVTSPSQGTLKAEFPLSGMKKAREQAEAPSTMKLMQQGMLVQELRRKQQQTEAKLEPAKEEEEPEPQRYVYQ